MRATADGVALDAAECLRLLWHPGGTKMRMRIPDTVLLDDHARPRVWLFTAKDGLVLKRSSFKTTAGLVKEAFVDKALRDPTNISKTICVARMDGGQALLLRGDEFLDLCDRLSRLEQDDGARADFAVPVAMQLYVRPLSDARFVCTYSVEGAQIGWECVPQRFTDGYVGSGPDERAPAVPATVPGTLLAELRQQTLVLIQFLEDAHALVPSRLVAEFVQDNLGKVYLVSIMEVHWAKQSEGALQVLQDNLGPIMAVPASLARQRRPPVQAFRSAGDAFAPPTARFPYASPRPPSAPMARRPASAGWASTTQTAAVTRRRPASSYSRKTGAGAGSVQPSGLAMELSKQVEACKAQIALLARQVDEERDARRDAEERAERAEQTLAGLQTESKSLAGQKDEITDTLTKVWVEAKQQSRQLQTAEQQLRDAVDKAETLEQEKDTLAKHLSDVIVELRARLQNQGSQQARQDYDLQDLRDRLARAEADVDNLRMERDVEKRKVAELQNLMAAKEREARMRIEKLEIQNAKTGVAHSRDGAKSASFSGSSSMRSTRSRRRSGVGGGGGGGSGSGSGRLAGRMAPSRKASSKASKRVVEEVPERDTARPATADEGPREEEAAEAIAPPQPEPETVPEATQDPPKDTTPTPVELELEHVYGYRGIDSQNNVFYRKVKRELIYPMGATVVVNRLEISTQRFYCGHTNDVVALAMGREDEYCASGQLGEDAYIAVWSIDMLETVAVLRGGHAGGVRALAFSADGNLIASVGVGDDPKIVLWDWRTENVLATGLPRTRIHSLGFHPIGSDTVVAGGRKFLGVWRYDHSLNLKAERSSTQAEILCTAYFALGAAWKTAVGTADGDLVVYEHTTAVDTVSSAHRGAVVALATRANVLASAGKDGTVRLWTTGNTLSALRTVELGIGAPIKALSMHERVFFVGTQENALYKVVASFDNVVSHKEIPPPEMVTGGHGPTSFSVHPKDLSAVLANGSNQVRFVDLANHAALRTHSHADAVTAVCYAQDALTIAMGTSLGAVDIVDAASLGAVHRLPDASETEAPVGLVRFSPDGTRLAVAQGAVITVYDVAAATKDGDAVPVLSSCRGHTGDVLQLDWSANSALLQSASAVAGEHLYWYAKTGEPIGIAAEVKDVAWASLTCASARAVRTAAEEGGIPESVAMVASCAARPGGAVVTADEVGAITLFKGGSKGGKKSYFGASLPVVQLEFSRDAGYLMSLSGVDGALLQWRVGRAK